MSIGAISGYGYQPYVYNTNSVGAASMNKLSKISDDVLDKKTDYSELVSEESKNTNPLKKGETLDFKSMLDMQMQRGQANAARVMKPAQEEDTASATVVQFSDAAAANETKAAENAQSQGAVENDSMANGNGFSSYQMQQAINAYEMFMTA